MLTVLDEEKALKELICLIHKNGDIYCPECGNLLKNPRIKAGKYVKCSCGKKVNWKSGSIFQGTRLSAARLYLLYELYKLKVDEEHSSKYASCSVDTVRFWYYKFEKMENKL